MRWLRVSIPREYFFRFAGVAAVARFMLSTPIPSRCNASKHCGKHRKARGDVRIDFQGRTLVKVSENHGRGLHRVVDEVLPPLGKDFPQLNRPIKIRLGMAGPIEQPAPLRPMASPPTVAGPVKQPASSEGRGFAVPT